MGRLYDKILNLKQEVSQIASNETLAAFDGDFCKILDDCDDPFIQDRVDKTLNELERIKDFEYSEHARTAYENYNEAVTYFSFKQRNVDIHDIPEASSSTPDFYINADCSIVPDDTEMCKIYMEVKTLGFADGNNIYKKAQEDAFNAQVELEKQHMQGKRISTAERVVTPLGNTDLQGEIEIINKKISNNVKQSQFEYGNSQDTILFVDLNQLWHPRNIEECLPVYPDLDRDCTISGRLWNVVFGEEGERVFGMHSFVGKGSVNNHLTRNGVMLDHQYVKGVIFGLGRKLEEKKYFGFYRYEEQELPPAVFIQKFCDFFNDDRNRYGYMYFEQEKARLIARFANENNGKQE